MPDTSKQEHQAKQHIVTIASPRLSETAGDCGQCQVSCQSACKTSCTVGNQICAQK